MGIRAADTGRVSAARNIRSHGEWDAPLGGKQGGHVLLI